MMSIEFFISDLPLQINNLLVADPGKRLSMMEVIQHEWVEGGGSAQCCLTPKSSFRTSRRGIFDITNSSGSSNKDSGCANGGVGASS
jgi:hypothetical protein